MFHFNFSSPLHWVKRVRIWSLSSPYFPALWLNSERNSISPNTPNTGTFHAVLESYPFWYHSMNYFIQRSIKNVSSKFYSLVGFLWVIWNSMFIALVSWLSQVSKFFTQSTLTMIKMIAFNSWFDFDNRVKRYPIVWFSTVVFWRY